MENSELQPKENLQVAELSPEEMGMDIYKGASMLRLTADEQKELMAPADAEYYEIRPDGFIYLPAALVRKKLNQVIGIGQWAIICQGTRKEDISDKQARIYFDGILMIRGNFISRATGENSYSFSNQNQSWASAVEAAKTDCLTRCVKDLGIATESREPSFIRKWQKQYAVRVWCKVNEYDRAKNGWIEKPKILWRRRDVDPFPNETGLVVKNPQPTVPQQAKKETLPEPLSEEWKSSLIACRTLPELTALYNQNKDQVDAWPELKEAFTKRQAAIKGISIIKKAATA
jgi:hypothetical protein